jgi:hypothetical protein
MEFRVSFFGSFSARAKRAIFRAHWQANKEGAQQITPEHILSGLLKEDPDLFVVVMPQNPNAVTELEGQVAADGGIRTTKKLPGESLPLSDRAKEVVFVSSEERKRLGHEYVGTQHLLLALLTTPRKKSSWFRRGEPQDDSKAKQILVKHGISAASVEAKIKEGIVTPLTWVLSDPIIKLNAQLTAIADLLISKGIFKRSEFVAILDQTEEPIAPEAFLAPLINALIDKGTLTAAESERVKSAGSVFPSEEQHTAGGTAPITEGGSSPEKAR